MKSIRPILAGVLLMAVAALVFATDKSPEDTKAEPQASKATNSSSIEWVSLDKGLQVAEAENKMILVDITASWCGWCKRMDKETFTDTSIISLINRSYVPVKLWGDSENMLEIEGYKISEKDLAASQFAVTGYPTFVFLCPDARGIFKAPGYRGSSDFRQLLTAVSEFDCDSAKASDDAEQQKKK